MALEDDKMTILKTALKAGASELLTTSKSAIRLQRPKLVKKHSTAQVAERSPFKKFFLSFLGSFSIALLLAAFLFLVVIAFSLGPFIGLSFDILLILFFLPTFFTALLFFERVWVALLSENKNSAQITTRIFFGGRM